VRRGIAELIDGRPGAIIPKAVRAAEVMPGRVGQGMPAGADAGSIHGFRCTASMSASVFMIVSLCCVARNVWAGTL
jgi:hypothetical protein